MCLTKSAFVNDVRIYLIPGRHLVKKGTLTTSCTCLDHELQPKMKSTCISIIHNVRSICIFNSTDLNAIKSISINATLQIYSIQCMHCYIDEKEKQQ